ncbi:MAG: hypothetical protein ACFFAE_10795 [Candidatus Hodarchaeota archaeon]
MESYINCPLCGTRNSVIFSFCKSCGSELPLTEKIPDEEPPDVFNQEETDIRKSSFNIEKSGFSEETYRISYSDNRDFIITRRSALNRIGLYAFFLIAFALIGIWGILKNITDPSEFGGAVVNYFITGIIQILLGFGLMVLINLYRGLRRITVYDNNEVRIGVIKGNLFFTRWQVSESSPLNNMTLRFGLFRSTGKMNTSYGSFALSRTKETAKVMDKKSEVYFSVESLDSIYVRRRFRIDSNNQLNPLLVCLASVCIIERMFRPKTEPD